MTDDILSEEYAAFAGMQKVAAGTLAAVAVALQVRPASNDPVLVFDGRTGRVVDLDLRGTAQDVQDRYSVSTEEAEAGPKGRGRPKLGVVAREITLLPRHWEWLQAQSGGASAALRRLVDDARKADAGTASIKTAQERTYRFLTAMAGDLPDYEEVVRALFAGNDADMAGLMAEWPQDIRLYAFSLLAR